MPGYTDQPERAGTVPMVMTAHNPDLTGRVLGDRYRLIALVGAGASAQVYLAEDTQLRRRVAVKVLHGPLASEPSVRRRFEVEARAAAALNHPHLLAVYDVGEEPIPYLVTEYLAGGSLRDLLAAGHRLSLSQALLVGLEAVRGLEHAHARGLVHRDIKPANLLFGIDGRLRIADFGLARVLAEAALTEPGSSMMGTARYASPEQARGEAAGPPTDIYSLALVLVEAVTGAVPFASGDHPVEGLARRASQPLVVPAPMGVLRGPLGRAGRLDPAERPDAGELAVSLLAAAGDLPRPAPLPLVVAEQSAEHEQPEGPPEQPPDPSPSGAPGTPPGTGATIVAAGQDDPTAILPLVAADPGRPPTGRQSTMVEDAGSLAPAFGEGPDLGAPTGPGQQQTIAPTAPGSPVARREGSVPSLYDQDMDDPPGEPRRGVAILVAVLIVAAVAGGSAWAWWSSRIPTHPVPELVGRSEADLAALIEEGAWTLDRTEVRLEDSSPGEIVGQDPLPGVDLAEGEVLAVEVSLGPPLVTIPTDLPGLSTEDAEAALEVLGLTMGDITQAFDEEAPEGQVLAIAADLDGVTELPQGSSVALTVSAGPEPRTVPEVAGSSGSEVRDTLEALGLAVEVTEKSSRSVDEGLVIEVTPAPGSTVERGDSVSVVVSKGLPWINLPDVTGLAVADATDALEDANLVVAGVEGPPNRTVVGTDPAPGVPIQEGRDVTLITRTPTDEGTPEDPG